MMPQETLFLDLVPVTGIYRGVSRSLFSVSIQPRKMAWKLADDMIQFHDMSFSCGNVYSEEYFKFLLNLKQKLDMTKTECEIIAYSEYDACSICSSEFLGYDVLGDIGESAIQEGNKISPRYSELLNDNGLFSTRASALEFCKMWADLIERNLSPWEVEQNPRPFGIWRIHETSFRRPRNERSSLDHQ